MTANLSERAMTHAHPRINAPLAIIGMACRLPGADDLEQFWRMLIEGRSAVSELPPDHLDRALLRPARKGCAARRTRSWAASYSRSVRPRQLARSRANWRRSADTCHLLMCEVAAQACRHAGLDPFNLPLRNTGVFIGHAQGSGLAGRLYCTPPASKRRRQFLRKVEAISASAPDQQQADDSSELSNGSARSTRREARRRADVSPRDMIAGRSARPSASTGPSWRSTRPAPRRCKRCCWPPAPAARAHRHGHRRRGSDCKSDSWCSSPRPVAQRHRRVRSTPRPTA